MRYCQTNLLIVLVCLLLPVIGMAKSDLTVTPPSGFFSDEPADNLVKWESSVYSFRACYKGKTPSYNCRGQYFWKSMERAGFIEGPEPRAGVRLSGIFSITNLTMRADWLYYPTETMPKVEVTVTPAGVVIPKAFYARFNAYIDEIKDDGMMFHTVIAKNQRGQFLANMLYAPNEYLLAIKNRADDDYKATLKQPFDLAEELVKRGWAVVHWQFAGNPMLMVYQQEAQEQGLGYWGLPENQREKMPKFLK